MVNTDPMAFLGSGRSWRKNLDLLLGEEFGEMWPAASNSDKLYAFLGAQNTH
jgi:hypothetical protein